MGCCLLMFPMVIGLEGVDERGVENLLTKTISFLKAQ